MGIRFQRKKPRHWGLTIAYKVARFLPVSRKTKLGWLLDLEWIAWRLAYETATDFGLHRTARNSFLLDRLSKEQSVLDLGCGRGDITADIAPLVGRAVGIDFNPANIAACEGLDTAAEFVCADARDYLASGQKFDVLVMSHVLEHLDDPKALLAEVAGRFDTIYIEVPDFDYSVINHIRQKMARSLIYSDADHLAEFDRHEMRELIEASGLTIVEADYIFGFQRYWVKRKTQS